MPKSRHRILSKSVANAAANQRAETFVSPPSFAVSTQKPRTRADEIYDLIEEACTFWFTDEDGRPWIERDGIDDKGGGLYLVRFRCPFERLENSISINKVVEKVCGILHSEVRYFCSERMEVYGGVRLRYYECAWVIQEGEKDAQDEIDFEDNNCESCIDTQEEIDGELTDESTAEEVDDRIESSLKNFV